MIPDDVLSSIEMIRDSARGIARQDLGRIRKLRFTLPGFDRSVWAEMCSLGWLALRLPEERGGAGLSLLAYAALAEEAGRALLPEPLIPAILASGLFDGVRHEQHIAGERLVLPAWMDGRDALEPARSLDIRDGRLFAHRIHVPLAAGADDFLVVGASRGALVAADAPGVEVTVHQTQDGGHVADVRFDGAPCQALAVDPRPALAEATLATAAYLLGLMDGALEITLAYLRQRVQFGKTLDQFQVLQHMAVDARLEIQLSRASIGQAALQWDTQGASSAAHAAISRAKARASAAARKVTRDCIQLHGGIGFTDEHDIGLFLRKAMVEAPRFGGPAQHRARFGQLKPIEQEC
ncbi:acyl-CoA dehydrogenase [Sphingomonas sp. CL5.1]|uniref:acyl-CoA dehydrogenase family protein n=1 Tax=Sphingomonas sp. CL5.1 TaxID=2653203 RepID=UPI0015832F6F|nr:acyl-CoA dehydrogenase family protein [Sphingomonas sp. CL5.1]QKR99260.1 acyl-CoA dehydrogenase [Sphingomonas sp. CL5.1]